MRNTGFPNKYENVKLLAQQADGTLTPVTVDASGNLVISDALSVDADGNLPVKLYVLDSAGDPTSVQLTINGSLKTEEQNLHAGEDLDADVTVVETRCGYRVVTKTDGGELVKNGPGRFYGFIVASSTGGTVTAYDNVAGAGVKVIDTMSVAAGDVRTWGVGVEFASGLYISIAGTASITVLYK